MTEVIDLAEVRAAKLKMKLEASYDKTFGDYWRRRLRKYGGFVGRGQKGRYWLNVPGYKPGWVSNYRELCYWGERLYREGFRVRGGKGHFLIAARYSADQ